MLYISAPCFLACQHPKAQSLWNIVFPNYSLIGMWGSGAKVRSETKKDLNTSQSMSLIFISYGSNNTNDSSEFWYKLFYLGQML